MRMILYDPLDKWIDPPCREIKRDLQPEELRFRAPGHQRTIHSTIITPQGTPRTHEKHLLHPELRLVLVTDRDVVADPDTPPEDAEHVDEQKHVRPRLNRDSGFDATEGEEEAQAAHYGKDHVCECPDLVHAAGSVDACYFEEQGADQAQVVTVACIPKDPADAEFEGLWVAVYGG